MVAGTCARFERPGNQLDVLPQKSIASIIRPFGVFTLLFISSLCVKVRDVDCRIRNVLARNKHWEMIENLKVLYFL